jgi:hypothetical protein
MEREMAESEYQRGEYSISTDKTKLDLPFIHDFLSQSSYWAQGRISVNVGGHVILVAKGQWL